jgi:hypothetical protein
VGAILWRFKPKTNQLTRNHMLVCLMHREFYPTWVSRLADRINDWNDLVERWGLHCEAAYEYDTYSLFKEKI